jgi:hypothetical protein
MTGGNDTHLTFFSITIAGSIENSISRTRTYKKIFILQNKGASSSADVFTLEKSKEQETTEPKKKTARFFNENDD